MQVTQYEQRYAAQIAALLQQYLPFEEENAQTIDALGGVRFVVVDNEEVVGFIAGYPIEHYEQQFPYFENRLMKIQQLVAQGVTYYTSHFVVHPAYRGQGLGTKLVRAYMQQVEQLAHAVVVVGWVQSDIDKWVAERQFMNEQLQSVVYIERYFEPYNVYCPNCAGSCYCDAHIVAKTFSV